MAGTLTPALGTPRKRDAGEHSPVLYLALHCDHPAAPGSRHSLAGIDRVLLGRGSAPAVVRRARELSLSVDEAWMSTKHAALHRSGDGWIVEDAKSRNGTRVNGALVSRAAGVQQGATGP